VQKIKVIEHKGGEKRQKVLTVFPGTNFLLKSGQLTGGLTSETEEGEKVKTGHWEGKNKKKKVTR